MTLSRAAFGTLAALALAGDGEARDAEKSWGIIEID